MPPGLIAAGCDVMTVQRALGHSTATTKLNTYSHLWPTAEDRTRKAAPGLLRQALASRRLPTEPSASSSTVTATHLDIT